MAGLIEERSTDHHYADQKPTSAIPKPPIGGVIEVDPAVIEELNGYRSFTDSRNEISVSQKIWDFLVVFDSDDPDSITKWGAAKILLEVARGKQGRLMLSGEYESMKTMHAVLPNFVPEVYAMEKCRNPEFGTHFFLAQFREVGQQPPDPFRFTARLADMHRTSKSPYSKFGFHVQTCHATVPQYVGWEDSWSIFYQKQQEHMFNEDEKQSGYWAGYTELSNILTSKVIPRLLEPLQSEGRNIKPCLIHGDLWDENCATDVSTGEPFIFDAGSFYAHNEYELGNWRQVRHRLSTDIYIESYKRNFPVSEPVQEWDDRNLLYSIHFDLLAAILFPEGPQRQILKNNMAVLCKKYFPEDVADLQRFEKPSSPKRDEE